MGRRGGHAIVLGASLAGLMTARVLSESFDSVTLVDRDVLPDGPDARPGVPQGWQSHGLHARGREILEELFPGLTEELVGHGASLGDVQADVRWVNDGHRLRAAPSGMLAIAFTRPLLEHLVRRRVRGLPGVDVRSPVDVLDLIATRDRVTGVRIRARGTTGEGEILTGDLVVDATGRGSHMPVWLESLGFPRPEESAIDIGVGYTTWDFPRTEGELGGALAAIITASVATPRFGAMLAAEGPRWQVTAGGYRGEYAHPTDLAAFRAFAASLPAGDIGELVADREPLAPGRLHRFPSNRRRRYERLGRFPAGLLVIGDALSSFNPAYGQGMTVAAVEALALRHLLAGPTGDADLARQFFRAAARVIDVPWDIAAGGDLRLPGIPGPRPMKVRLINTYVARVQAAAAVDPRVGLAFLRVANTVERPETLLRPSVVVRVLRAGLSKDGRATQRRPDAFAPAARPVPAPRRPADARDEERAGGADRG